MTNFSSLLKMCMAFCIPEIFIFYQSICSLNIIKIIKQVSKELFASSDMHDISSWVNGYSVLKLLHLLHLTVDKRRPRNKNELL